MADNKIKERIRELSEELRVLKASIPVHCQRCGEIIPRFDTRNLDGALEVTLDGGYGMFMDEAPWTFPLCKSCCFDLVDFLGIKIENLQDVWRDNHIKEELI